MPDKETQGGAGKPSLHPRNAHKGRYDLKALCQANPDLKSFVAKNKYGNLSIDFFNPLAVKALNKGLLLLHYDIDFWDLPEGYLCPPVPGRADYIHHIADVLAESNTNTIPRGNSLRCLDIGVGANCIYPIIGNNVYGWSFTGSDIDEKALDWAKQIVDLNQKLKGKIEFRIQPNPMHILHTVLQKDELFDLVVCNPPFHASQAEAEAGTLRKLRNLKNKRIKHPKLNFGGKGGELWTDGGERRFVLKLINESAQYPKSCAWYSSLVSKHSNLKTFYDRLEQIGVSAHKTKLMGQGNKMSRVISWTFLNSEEMQAWAEKRWTIEKIPKD